MVAALIASGASAGAVTDPNSQDPRGKTPASIAATNGHKGLAGYLSEVALTSHLSSLTLEESELSKGSAEVEAEITVNSISKGSLALSEDQITLKDTLAAVRNAAQAAARIQSAFRAHSFRKRIQRQDSSAASIDDYGINSDDISALSRLAFRNPRVYNSAALSIQKKYRGWKSRKDFLAFRQKIVKIQAHVRGYQVRKHYKEICWAVGILDKVVLRWRRKGVGLRGFRNDTQVIDETGDEDILKVFRKQKVDVAIEEAVSRVLSMVDSPEARQQYHRVLEIYRQAKFTIYILLFCNREKMVAALIASGASAGAVTDPNSQDPRGKTPASIAATNGHKGLAGYLSEVALTSHLSSLTLEESELSKGSAEVEAEITVNSISKGSLALSEDQITLKDTLAAVRNAAQAAARIQSAFRAHSFRKRIQRQDSSAASIDDYGINSDDISALSRLAFRNPRVYNSAALSIQKKYRGWKSRKDFLAFRQKIVKIQAHVRGYQVRKHYKEICWAVGILDKVVLRWRRKGVGLRGFRNDTQVIDETGDEDILKVFRKQKVDVAIEEAVSRVLSMVDSPEARQQYHRVLEIYRQAKVSRREILN
ncbi:calmodulin-binding transcription activator 4 [Quercus suber]|uniref:Calmodulin-binding transcription activator 4 n=2 Tax=Quercus suber TaxID=58331 RepID=A0AAW0LLL1_QUESU